MVNDETIARLFDLLIEPQESLGVEAKNWLDIETSNADKATLAKSLLAIANHGCGLFTLRPYGTALIV
jgi:hypothetical protein